MPKTLKIVAHAVRDASSDQEGADIIEHWLRVEAAKPQLTLYEKRLLLHLSGGETLPEIAKEMLVSVSTLKNQANSLYRKFNVHNRIACVGMAIAMGIIKFQWTDSDPTKGAPYDPSSGHD